MAARPEFGAFDGAGSHHRAARQLQRSSPVRRDDLEILPLHRKRQHAVGGYDPSLVPVQGGNSVLSDDLIIDSWAEG